MNKYASAIYNPLKDFCSCHHLCWISNLITPLRHLFREHKSLLIGHHARDPFLLPLALTLSIAPYLSLMYLTVEPKTVPVVISSPSRSFPAKKLASSNKIMCNLSTWPSRPSGVWVLVLLCWLRHSLMVHATMMLGWRTFSSGSIVKMCQALYIQKV